MAAIVIYWSLQIEVWVLCVFLFIRRRDGAAKPVGRKDTPFQRIALLVIMPMLCFGYACLGGYPPKEDQLHFVLVVTLFIYGVLIARWVRQSRSSTPPV